MCEMAIQLITILNSSTEVLLNRNALQTLVMIRTSHKTPAHREIGWYIRKPSVPVVYEPSAMRLARQQSLSPQLETRLKSSDLAHGRATTTDAAAAHVGAAAVLQPGEDRGDEEGDEAEPQEGGGGLGLAAALRRVVRAVGDDVGGGVCLRDELASRGCGHGWVEGAHGVAAAVHAEVAGCRDGGDEPEEGVQRVEGDHDDRVERELLLDGRGDEVQERRQRKDRHEHVEVDYAVVAGEGLRDHVADQRHDEDGPQELQRCQPTGIL